MKCIQTCLNRFYGNCLFQGSFYVTKRGARWVHSYDYYNVIHNNEFHGTFVFKACTTLSCCLLMLVIVASDVCWALFSCCSSRFTSSLVASRLFLVDTNCDCRHIMDIYNTMTCNTLHNNIYYHTGSESCTCGPGLKGVHMYRYETSRQLA